MGFKSRRKKFAAPVEILFVLNVINLEGQPGVWGKLGNKLGVWGNWETVCPLVGWLLNKGCRPGPWFFVYIIISFYN